MSKKVYIRVDKPIEPGDLVRCVRDDGEYKQGDIRKVSQLAMSSNDFFYIFGSGMLLWKSDWEVVHKLEVGDKVGFNRRIKTVIGINPDSNQFYTTDGPLPYICNSQFELYQPERHDPRSTLGVDYSKEQSLGILTKQEHLEKTIRCDIMKTQIAEMIVELLGKENPGWSNVGISINPERRKTVVMDVKRSGVAICSHRDNPDTLTGVYVALSKAAGRKLPDWIYGEER